MKKRDISRALLKKLLYVPMHIVVFIRNKIHASRKDYHKAKAADIINGFANLAFENPKVENLAKLRADICGRCPKSVPIGVITEVTLDKRTIQVNGMKCDECGCMLSAKVRSIESYCPLGKW